MKKNKNGKIVTLLAASILMTLCMCKSPTQQETVAQPTVMGNDSAVAGTPDTSKTALSPNASLDTAARHNSLKLVITNLASPKAPVIIGVYGEKSKFPDPKGQLREYKFVPDHDTLFATITDLEFGAYAMALYQDVNSNGKIDKNLIGIPTEPYGFSNNYKPTVKAPAFKNCRFDYTQSANTISVKMIR